MNAKWSVWGARSLGERDANNILPLPLPRAQLAHGREVAGVPEPEMDRLIGERVRQARRFAGLSQAGAGRLIGVSFQQMQRFEMGQNRLSAARLWRLATALGVPLQFFFQAAAERVAALEGAPTRTSPAEEMFVNLADVSSEKAALLRIIAASDEAIVSALAPMMAILMAQKRVSPSRNEGL